MASRTRRGIQNGMGGNAQIPVVKFTGELGDLFSLMAEKLIRYYLREAGFPWDHVEGRSQLVAALMGLADDPKEPVK